MKHPTLLLLILLGMPAGATEPAPNEPAPRAEGGTDSAKGSGRFVPKEQRRPVPFESPKGGIFFRAKLAERDIWVMLDTGASHSMMDTGFARAVGLTLTPHEHTMKTPRGEVPTWQTTESTLHVPGQIELRIALPRVADFTAINAVTTHKVEFVLGADILSGLVLVVDPGKQTLQFGPSGSFKAPAPSLQVALKGNAPQVEVTIGSQPVLVAVDTGFTGELSLVPEAWAKVVPKNAPTGTGIVATADGKTFAVKTVVLPEIQIGSLSLTDVRVKEQPHPRMQGLLGTGILLKFRFALDMKAGSLVLGALPPRVPPQAPSAEADSTG